MPRVSILLPVYNASTTIERALKSIQEQTLQDHEILIWNDGGTDASAKIINQAAQNDSRIQILGDGTNKGIVSALNGLITASNSPLLARMDADDVMHPDRLRLQVDYLHKHPEIGLVSSRVYFAGDVQAQEGYAIYVDWLNEVISSESIRLNRFVESPFAHPSVLFRRSLTEQYGSYRQGNFPEDYELWLRWIEAGVKMTKLPDHLLTWYDHGDRLSRRDQRYTSDRFHEVKAMYLALELKRLLQNRALWICGAGRIARRRSNYLLQHQIEIAGYIDVDPRKTSRSSAQKPVLHPDALKDPETIFVVSYITNRGARDIIRNMLVKKRFQEGKDFIMAG